jgi:hypothetical protein
MNTFGVLCLACFGCRYESAEPHQQPLPGHWHEQLGGRFAALLVVKQLREEKLVFAAQQYVAAKLGREFTEPEPWTLDGVFQETSARTPIIFILSTGGCCNAVANDVLIAACSTIQRAPAAFFFVPIQLRYSEGCACSAGSRAAASIRMHTLCASLLPDMHAALLTQMLLPELNRPCLSYDDCALRVISLFLCRC